METITNYHVAEIELTYRTKVAATKRTKISQSSDLYNLFLENWDISKIELQEQVKVVFLNRANKTIALYDLSTGGTASTIVDVKLIFVAALKTNASFIAIAHNHPSGSLSPSSHDIAITKKIAAGAKLLDLQLIDHIIVTEDGYYSFADQGMF